MESINPLPLNTILKRFLTQLLDKSQPLCIIGFIGLSKGFSPIHKGLNRMANLIGKSVVICSDHPVMGGLTVKVLQQFGSQLIVEMKSGARTETYTHFITRVIESDYVGGLDTPLESAIKTAKSTAKVLIFDGQEWHDITMLKSQIIDLINNPITEVIRVSYKNGKNFKTFNSKNEALDFLVSSKRDYIWVIVGNPELLKARAIDDLYKEMKKEELKYNEARQELHILLRQGQSVYGYKERMNIIMYWSGVHGSRIQELRKQIDEISSMVL